MAQDKAAHRSTQRVLDILSTLSNSDAGMSMADICRALDAPKSSLFPILHTMAASRFIAYDDATGRYSIGIRSHLLGASYRSSDGTLEVIEAAMREIVHVCEETSQLGVLDRRRVLYVAKVDSAQPVSLRSNIGRTLGITYTAIGKALMSERSDDEILDIIGSSLERPTEKAAGTPEEFLAGLSEVRETGFAYDREETSEGICCIAVPLRQAGRITYGLSVTVPSYRLDEEKKRLIESKLIRAKKDIERIIP